MRQKTASQSEDASTASAARTGDGVEALQPIGELDRSGWSDEEKVAYFTKEWPLGFLVRDLHRMFRMQLKERVEKHGINVGMWSYLWALYEEDGLSQHELARRVKLVGPSVVAAINQMEKKGIAERRRSETDRRVVHVHLTQKAWDLRPVLLSEGAGLVERAVKYLGNSEIQLLCSLLNRVRHGASTD